MRRRPQSWHLHRSAKRRRENILRNCAKATAAKAAKRMLNPIEREPQLIRFHPLEFGLRDKISGDAAWVDFRSIRDVVRRLSVVREFYQPGKARV